MFDIIIIGAGVVGSMIARTLSKYKLDILVLEKRISIKYFSIVKTKGYFNGCKKLRVSYPEIFTALFFKKNPFLL